MCKRIFYQFICKENLLDFRKLFLLYFGGIVFGCLISFFVSDYLICFLAPSFLVRPSLFGVLFSNLMPFLILLCLRKSPVSYLCYPFMFLNSAMTGFAGFFVLQIFKDVAWLIRPLLMFSAGSVSVFLWWILISSNEELNRRSIIIALIVLISIFFFDYFVISRFIYSLIVYF